MSEAHSHEAGNDALRCWNCDEPIEDRVAPKMSGPEFPVWAHVGRGMLCDPEKKRSTSAMPTPPTIPSYRGRTKDNETK